MSLYDEFNDINYDDSYRVVKLGYLYQFMDLFSAGINPGALLIASDSDIISSMFGFQLVIKLMVLQDLLVLILFPMFPLIFLLKVR